jgi:hypothetical protein
MPGFYGTGSTFPTPTYGGGGGVGTLGSQEDLWRRQQEQLAEQRQREAGVKQPIPGSK